MNENVIIAMFTFLGATIGVLGTFIISLLLKKKDENLKRLKSNVETLSNQVVSYWNLEKKYSEEVSKLISKPTQTVLREFRDAIVDDGYERPTMTELEAKKLAK